MDPRIDRTVGAELPHDATLAARARLADPDREQGLTAHIRRLTSRWPRHGARALTVLRRVVRARVASIRGEIRRLRTSSAGMARGTTSGRASDTRRAIGHGDGHVPRRAGSFGPDPPPDPPQIPFL